MKKVLILCTGNSVRSQIAEAFINRELAGEWTAYSAGVNPFGLNPRAVRVMAEVGIDISNNRSKSVEEFINRDDLDLIITVCNHAKETCPVFLNPVKQVHLGFEDPAEYSGHPDEVALPVFRRIRDKIRNEVLDYLKGL